jgi:hypothetical protein
MPVQSIFPGCSATDEKDNHGMANVKLATTAGTLRFMVTFSSRRK